MNSFPPHWESFSLGELLLRIEAGKSFAAESRPASADEWGIIKVSAMTYGEFRESENKAVFEGESFSKSAEIRPGDVLLSRANTINYVGASVVVGNCRPRLLLSDKSLRLVPSGALDRRWLWYFLMSPQSRKYLRDASSGSKSGMRNVSQSSLRAMPVALPPLTEQRAIVNFLDSAMSAMGAAERGLGGAETQLGIMRSSVIDAVINPPGRRSCQLGDLVARVEAGRSLGGAARPAKSDEWGIIKVSSMTRGHFREDENKAIPAEAADPRFEIRSGDLLVSRANALEHVGASVLVGSTRPRLLLSDKSLRVVPCDGVDSRWLWLVLSSPKARAQMSARASGTKDSMRNLSRDALLSVKIPSPTMDEQIAEISRVSEYSAHISLLADSVRLGSRKAEALRRSLLNAAIVGRLVHLRGKGVNVHV